MMLVIGVVALAIAMLFGLAIGVEIGKDERDRLCGAIEEWAAADRALPKYVHPSIPAYRRLERAETELRALAAAIGEDDFVMFDDVVPPPASKQRES